MALRPDQRNITITVSSDLAQRIATVANARGESVSKMLAAWLDSGIDAPLERTGKRQSVRRYKDEAMISLPRDWQRRTGVAPGSHVTIAYSDDALIIRAE
jgi:hypothetical protein